jgi:hypothetical protein
VLGGDRSPFAALSLQSVAPTGVLCQRSDHAFATNVVGSPFESHDALKVAVAAALPSMESASGVNGEHLAAALSHPASRQEQLQPAHSSDVSLGLSCLRWHCRLLAWELDFEVVSAAHAVARSIVNATLPASVTAWTESGFDSVKLQTGLRKVLRVVANLGLAPRPPVGVSSGASAESVRNFVPVAARTILKSSGDAASHKGAAAADLWRNKRGEALTIAYGCARCGCDHGEDLPCPLAYWSGDWRGIAALAAVVASLRAPRSDTPPAVAPVPFTFNAPASAVNAAKVNVKNADDDAEIVDIDNTGAFSFDAPALYAITREDHAELKAAVAVATRARGRTASELYLEVLEAAKRRAPVEAATVSWEALAAKLAAHEIFDAATFLAGVRACLASVPADVASVLMTTIVGIGGSDAPIGQQLLDLQTRKRAANRSWCWRHPPLRTCRCETQRCRHRELSGCGSSALRSPRVAFSSRQARRFRRRLTVHCSWT